MSKLNPRRMDVKDSGLASMQVGRQEVGITDVRTCGWARVEVGGYAGQDVERVSRHVSLWTGRWVCRWRVVETWCGETHGKLPN